MIFALLLLLSGSRLVLDDTIEIPRGEWRYVDVAAKESKAVVNCEYRVVSENTPVRALWIARKNLETFRGGRRENTLASTPFAMEGKLRHFAAKPGDYAMVLESLPGSPARATVKVKVWLESAVSPRVLSSRRRLAVILVSAIVFFSMVSFAAFKLRGQAPG